MSEIFRVALLGRTEMLLQAGEAIAACGHKISLVATCRPSGHELATLEDYRRFAEIHGAPFILGPKLDNPDLIKTIRDSRSDVAISMNWLTLIPQIVRALFPWGIFNAHPGDLPRYKGNACPNWAILMGERTLALSIHEMVDELDSGPIAIKRHFTLTGDTTIADVYAWLRNECPQAFSELVNLLASGRCVLSPQPQDLSAHLRCYPRRPEDARIDWRQNSDLVYRLIRASGRPFCGAFTTLENKRVLRVWAASTEIGKTQATLAVPGQVLGSIEGDPVIACGSGSLRLIDIEVEGAGDGENAKRVIVSSLRNRLA